MRVNINHNCMNCGSDSIDEFTGYYECNNCGFTTRNN